MSKGYIDFKLVEQFPNKYHIEPTDIKKLKILDWDKLKKHTWLNKAKTNGTWYCHLEGSNGGGLYGDEDDFWIGFREEDNKIDFHFTSAEGMCGYKFNKFYDALEIENKWDMQVQVNAIKFLNMLLDEKIISKEIKESE